MRKPNSIIIAVILVCVGLSGVCAAGEAVAAASALNNELKADAARQLRIYKDALFRGTSEQSRQDAAIELLLRDDKASREILLETLLGKNNEAARQAVCRGLISCRALGTVIRNRNDFREGLIGILVDEDGLDAQLAAEAMLLFKYRELSSGLESLVRSGQVERRVRLNVVYALKIRPDKEAMSELIKLLDDADVEIAGAAEKALQDSFGIPVGTDKEVWVKILKDLQRKSPNEIRRERLLQQETRVRKLQAERDLWQRTVRNKVTVCCQVQYASYPRPAPHQCRFHPTDRRRTCPPRKVSICRQLVAGWRVSRIWIDSVLRGTRG